MSEEAAPAIPRPGYWVPVSVILAIAVSVILGRKRSFTRDAGVVLRANLHLPRRIEGVEHIPADGPFIAVMNHYSRRGLRPFHCGMPVAEAVAQVRPGQPEIHWAFTSEYVDLRIGPLPIPVWFLRWLFARVARLYGFVTIARREEMVMGRATALRQLARLVTSDPVGLTPEGLEGSRELIEPQPGTGLFLTSIAGRRAPLLPIGLFEEDGTLCVRFGEPFRLDIPAGLARAEQDRRASEQVMLAIGRLLPPSYWGAYTEQLSRANG